VTTVAAAMLLGAVFGTGRAAATEGEIVTCYDAARKVVTHTLRQACSGVIVSPRRAYELVMAERPRVQSAVDGQLLPDPVTGKRRLTGTGSGFCVGRNGEILTNDHVISRCAMLTATADGDSKHAAALVATSPVIDIALLRTARRPPAIARFSSAPRPRTATSSP
jgi:S1-C subfamily serine protease